MSIMTVEMRGARGLGDVSASTQRALDAMRINRAQSELAVRFPGAYAIGSDSAVAVGGDFMSTYGVPIGAGVAGLAVGLVIAKLARARRK